MNGPDHYRAAERLIEELSRTELNSPREGVLIAEAQVHATLALCAAVADVADSSWEGVVS